MTYTHCLKNDDLVAAIRMYRQLREHEDNVKNHRMGWLWALQGLLFNALTNVWTEAVHPGLLIIICTIGAISCFSIGHAIRCSSVALDRMTSTGRALLRENFNCRCGDLVDIVLGDLDQDRDLKPVKCLLPWNMLSYAIGCSWVLILVFLILQNYL